MTNKQIHVGLVFGGRSPEHEVSVITALQAAAALEPSKYRPFPIYVAKDGSWYTGGHLLNIEAFSTVDVAVARATKVGLVPGPGRTLTLVETGVRRRFALPRRHRLDVLLLGLHGGAGENGSFQGLCETLGVPYTGSGVLGSALGMDKVACKMVCRDQGVKVVPFHALREAEWADQEDQCLDVCESRLGYPMVVKPARLGSSIGISKPGDRAGLNDAIEEAFRYDEKVVVELAVRNLVEVNCAVLGDPDGAMASALEQPVPSQEASLLSFRDKYMRQTATKGERGGSKRPASATGASQGMASLDRIIPAPLPDDKAEHVRAMALQVFALFECAGVARLDFLLDAHTGDVYFNEINTIPGSFAFYLWEPIGVTFGHLLDRMIGIAQQRAEVASRRVLVYDANLLSERSLAGLKGAKKAE